MNVKIAFCADGKWYPYVSVAIQSIIDNSSIDRNYEIFVLNYDADEFACDRIKWKLPKNVSVQFVDMSEYIKKYRIADWFHSGRLNYAAYFRLFLPLVLPDADKVLYLDSDAIPVRDVADLYDIDLGENLVGAAHEVIYMKDSERAGLSEKLYMGEFFNYCERVLGMTKPSEKYFNSGVVLMNLRQMRIENTIEQFLKYAKINNAYFHDQNVLNAACQDRVFYIPQEWNFMTNWFADNSQFVDKGMRDKYQQMLRDKSFGIIHYSCYPETRPWITPLAPLGEYWWGGARNTAFYESILENICKGEILSKLADMATIEEAMRADLDHLKLWRKGVLSNGLRIKIRRSETLQFMTLGLIPKVARKKKECRDKLKALLESK
ncbi:MAG: glycosyltransferase family 8 protein [Alphaproteobacteria bacterium]|nr:glycosyltransferase family 8 protein [Alphaproteobacteria bacterium]